MQALQLIISLSILVLVHELGHFTFAKLFGTRVDKFYLFFNPWFSIYKKKIGETEYGIGWLPLGGYCKIAGMVDESMDKEQLKQPPQPYEYRSKKLWQRFLIISGGVIFNFIFALMIYAGMLYVWGESYLPLKNMEYGIYVDSTAQSLGLHSGDRILSIDGVEPERLDDVRIALLFDEARTLRVNHNGKEIEIAVPKEFNRQLINNSDDGMFISYFMPEIIDSLIPQSPAERAGLHKGDRVVAIDTVETPGTFNNFVKIVNSYAGKTINLIVERNGFRDTVSITISPEGTIGAYMQNLEDIYTFETCNFTLLQSIPEGARMGGKKLVFYVKQMKFVFTKEGLPKMGSLISMANLYPTAWNWFAFWNLMALFSIILAFMNILPIPALDGGHLLFLIYEFFTGKQPSDNFLMKAQMVGMAIVLSIFFFALFMDIERLF